MANNRQFVFWLQRQLNRHGAELKEDGIVGPKTRAAIQAFQRRTGTKVTGMATDATVKALRGGPQGDRPKVPTPRPSPARNAPARPAAAQGGMGDRIRQMMTGLGTSPTGVAEVMGDYERLGAERAAAPQFRPPVGNFPTPQPSPMGASIPAGQSPMGMPAPPMGMPPPPPMSMPGPDMAQMNGAGPMPGMPPSAPVGQPNAMPPGDFSRRFDPMLQGTMGPPPGSDPSLEKALQEKIAKDRFREFLIQQLLGQPIPQPGQGI